MIRRENLGVIENGNSYHVSIPTEVAHIVGDYGFSHPDIVIEKVGHGYHNAGWEYYEYRIRAASPSKAQKAAEAINFLAYCEFQGV